MLRTIIEIAMAYFIFCIFRMQKARIKKLDEKVKLLETRLIAGLRIAILGGNLPQGKRERPLDEQSIEKEKEMR